MYIKYSVGVDCIPEHLGIQRMTCMSLCVVHHSGWSQTTAFPNMVHYSLYIGNDVRGYSTPCDMYTDKDVSCTSCSTHMHAMSPDL